MSDENIETRGGNWATVTSSTRRSAVHAILDDLRTAAATLTSMGGNLVSYQARVLAIGWNLPRTGDLLSPTTAVPYLSDIKDLTLGEESLGGHGAIAFALGTHLQLSVAGYTAAESVADTIVGQVQRNIATARLATALVYGLASTRGTKDLDDVLTDTFSTVPGAGEGVPALVDSLTGGVGSAAIIRLLGGVGNGAAAHAGPVTVTERQAPGRGSAIPPVRSISSGARRINHLHDNGSKAAHLQVQRVVDASGHGRWLVLIPGTQDFARNRPNPADGTGNLQSMAGHPSAMSAAVTTALSQAQHREGVEGKGEPVMVIRHSQGGMVASNLARDPRVTSKFNIAKVATFGSPVGHLSPGTDQLDVVNSRDLVPTVSGPDLPGNDERRTRLTIHDPTSMTNSDGRREVLGAHDIQNYADDYEDALRSAHADSQLRKFDDSTRDFFTGSARSYVYDAHRQPAPQAR